MDKYFGIEEYFGVPIIAGPKYRGEAEAIEPDDR
jgi:hypothetical protein